MIDAVWGMYYTGTARWCPVCESSSRRFREFGTTKRAGAQCVRCRALERHRFFWLYVTQRTNLFDGNRKRVLHVAPERCLEPRLKNRLGESYMTADLQNPRAMVTMDITDIDYADRTFDVILCNHVLEHVDDDRRAMREFYRVLKDDGWAIMLVPISGNKTYEDPSIVDPAERYKAFGQSDHVRIYGADFADRLSEAGFRVHVSDVQDVADDEEAVRLGLTQASDPIFFCTRR